MPEHLNDGRVTAIDLRTKKKVRQFPHIIEKSKHYEYPKSVQAEADAKAKAEADKNKSGGKK